VWQALKNNEDVPHIQVDLSEDEEKLALAVFDPITYMAETDAETLDALLREVNTGEEALQALLRELATDAGLDYGTGEDQIAGADMVPEQWAVMVQCGSESEQADLLQRLEAEGYSCHALIS
jgi:hypothetical protein